MKKDRPKLYERLPNGRYIEYQWPERPEVDNALYRRCGKRYEPVSMHFECNSWQEGVFAVTKNHSADSPDHWVSADYLQEIFHLYKCGEIENVSIGKLAGMDKLTNYLCRHWNEVEGASVYERCASIVALLMRCEESADERDFKQKGGR